MAVDDRHFRYQAQNVQIFKSQSLGVGSYGAVYRARCDQLPCAAKLLHPILANPGAPRNQQRFELECQFLSAIRHPHIVQYLGTYRDPESGLPVLLMELMDDSLTHFLERSPKPLPYHLEVNLCHDVALALAYLHSNGIIHRDLSSNNVLLIAGSRAKVTDFGMSKLVDAAPQMTPLTQCPGTAAYMSPEAMREPPVYTDKLDCFAHGVMAIQIMTREFPNPGPASHLVDYPQSPTGTILMPVPETERRKPHIDRIDPTHSLLPTAIRCLSYNEKDRPSAQQLCYQLATMKEAPRYVESVQRAQERVAGQEEDQHLRQELEQANRDIQQQDGRIAELQRNIAVFEWDIRELQERLREKDAAAVASQQEIQQLTQDNQQLMQEKNDEIEGRDRQLRDNEQMFAELQQTLVQKDKRIRDLEETISARERSIEDLQLLASARNKKIEQLQENIPIAEENTVELAGANELLRQQLQQSGRQLERENLVDKSVYEALQQSMRRGTSTSHLKPHEELTANEEELAAKQAQIDQLQRDLLVAQKKIAELKNVRICPVCNTRFPSRMRQQEFERHVAGHFRAQVASEELAEKQTKIDQLQQEVMIAQENKELHANLETVTNERDALRQENTALQAKNETINGEVDALKKQLATRDDQMHELEQNLVREGEHVKEIEHQIQVVRESEQRVMEKLDRERAHNKHLQEDYLSENTLVQSLQKQLEDQETKMATVASEELAEKQTEIDQLQQEVLIAKANMVDLAGANELLRQQLQQSGRQLERENLAAKQAQIDQLQRDLLVAQKKIAELENVRICPVCNTRFPSRMRQQEFERHVALHFQD